MTENKRVTVYDVAERAGVAVSTVTRALNNKKDISDKTKEKILRIADELGFKATISAQRMRQKTLRIVALIHAPVDDYQAEVVRGIQDAAELLRDYNVDVQIYGGAYVDALAAEQEACEVMNRLVDNPPDGLVYSAFIETEILCDLAARLRQKGMVLTALTSDLNERDLFVMTDGKTAGCLAAEMLDLGCHGKKVAVVTGSVVSAIHRSNVTGFYEYGTDRFQSIELVEHRDNPALVVQKTEELLKRTPDLAGLYLTTASSGLICKWLEQNHPHLSLQIIATDLYEDTKQYLHSGRICATVFQNPYMQAFSALHLTYQHIQGKNRKGVYYYDPELVFRSNCEADFKESLHYAEEITL